MGGGGAFNCYDAATVTLDFNAGLDFIWSTNAARTLANPLNAKPGQKGVVEIYNQGSGSIASWGSFWKFPGGVKPTLVPGYNAISYVVANDATYILCNASVGFA